MRSYWNSLRISCNYIGDYAIGIYYVHSVHTYTRARARHTDFFSPIKRERSEPFRLCKNNYTHVRIRSAIIKPVNRTLWKSHKSALRQASADCSRLFFSSHLINIKNPLACLFELSLTINFNEVWWTLYKTILICKRYK